MNKKGEKLRRRKRNYLALVEAELFAIYREAKVMSEDGAEVTPSDMHSVKMGALRALSALGWEPK